MKYAALILGTFLSTAAHAVGPSPWIGKWAEGQHARVVRSWAVDLDGDGRPDRISELCLPSAAEGERGVYLVDATRAGHLAARFMTSGDEHTDCDSYRPDATTRPVVGGFAHQQWSKRQSSETILGVADGKLVILKERDGGGRVGSLESNEIDWQHARYHRDVDGRSRERAAVLIVASGLPPVTVATGALHRANATLRRIDATWVELMLDLDPECSHLAVWLGSQAANLSRAQDGTWSLAVGTEPSHLPFSARGQQLTLRFPLSATAATLGKASRERGVVGALTVDVGDGASLVRLYDLDGARWMAGNDYIDAFDPDAAAPRDAADGKR